MMRRSPLEYNSSMITIAPLRPDQIADAKSVITAVAQRIFEPDKPADEFSIALDEEHELRDVDDFEQIYAGDRGLFLAVMEDGRLVGTGAIKPLTAEAAELKRLWLLEEYHGQGIGYQVVMRLFEFARQAGYNRVCLQTSLMQVRAIAFYKRIGFVEVPDYHESPYDDDISLEIHLNP